MKSDRIRKLDIIHKKWIKTLQGKIILHDSNSDITAYTLTQIIVDNANNDVVNKEVYLHTKD